MCSVMKKWNDGVVATFNLCESLCPFVKLEEPSTLGIVYMY